MLDSRVNCGAMVWSEHPNLNSVACVRGLDPGGHSQLRPFPNLYPWASPSTGTCCVTRRWLCSSVVPEALARRVLALGTDTILPLYEHPWWAIIRLFWPLIREAVPWITHPGWPLPTTGLLGAGCRGPGRCGAAEVPPCCDVPCFLRSQMGGVSTGDPSDLPSLGSCIWAVL